MAKRTKTDKSLTHFIAYCRQCEFSTECYIKGQRQVSKHVRDTEHTVDVDWGYTGEYRPE